MSGDNHDGLQYACAQSGHNNPRGIEPHTCPSVSPERDLRCRRVTFALLMLPANSCFYQIRIPVTLLQLIVQQAQLPSHGVDFRLPVLDDDCPLYFDLRISGTVSRLAPGIDNAFIYADFQRKRILSRYELRQRLSVDFHPGIC